MFRKLVAILATALLVVAPLRADYMEFIVPDPTSPPIACAGNSTVWSITAAAAFTCVEGAFVINSPVHKITVGEEEHVVIGASGEWTVTPISIDYSGEAQPDARIDYGDVTGRFCNPFDATACILFDATGIAPGNTLQLIAPAQDPEDGTIQLEYPNDSGTFRLTKDKFFDGHGNGALEVQNGADLTKSIEFDASLMHVDSSYRLIMGANSSTTGVDITFPPTSGTLALSDAEKTPYNSGDPIVTGSTGIGSNTLSFIIDESTGEANTSFAIRAVDSGGILTTREYVAAHYVANPSRYVATKVNTFTDSTTTCNTACTAITCPTAGQAPLCTYAFLTVSTVLTASTCATTTSGVKECMCTCATP